MTCASSDPLVATLFAIESMNYGAAIVMLVPRTPFTGMIGPPNHGADLEAAVNLTITPLEFARQALRFIEAASSRGILVDLGFDRMPTRIAGKSGLRIALEQSRTESYRLSVEQILEFNRRAMEVQHD